MGRLWGHLPSEVPSEREAVELLQFAHSSGIRYFDSAPSYGLAEERLSIFLRSLDHARRGELTVATKFGEHWNAERREPYVDHTYDALCRSLDRSVELLGRIHFLQLHKTTPEVLRSADLARAWDYAESLGIRHIGASVSDLDSAGIVIEEPRYSCIQLPLNLANTKFSPVVDKAAARGMWVATNRPFAMGAMLYGDRSVSLEDAFRFVLSHSFDGVVLSGTKSINHLADNWAAFERVRRTAK